MCVSRGDRQIDDLGELIEAHVIRVLLRSVRPAVPKQRLQRDNIAAALAKKPICEAVSELMKRERTDAAAPADTPDHPHQCLPAGRPLRIEAPTLALERRNPLLDLNDEDVGVVLRGAPAYERERARQAACLTELLRLDDA